MPLPTGTGRQVQRRRFGVHEDSSDSDDESTTTQETMTLTLAPDSHVPPSPPDVPAQSPQSFTSLAADLIEAVNNDDAEHSTAAPICCVVAAPGAQPG